MIIPCYLAMTAAQYAACAALPPHIGWMACHFSLQNNGLSNLPEQLPKASMLILDDSIPMENHSIDRILEQLSNVVQKLEIAAVLLDFQRHSISREKELSSAIGAALPCPVAAPPEYTTENMPIFLPPIPLHKPLMPCLSKFSGREIWLDAAPVPCRFKITAAGCDCEPLFIADAEALRHAESQMHCHYSIAVSDTEATFTLGRSKGDFFRWLQDAQSLGVTRVVGLYQELIAYCDLDNC